MKTKNFMLVLILTLLPSFSHPAVGQSDNGTLQNLWSYTFLDSWLAYNELGPSAAIADMNSAPGLEIVTGNREYYPFGYSSSTISGRWFMFKADGSLLWWTNTTNDEARSSVLLGDLLQNGSLKIVGGTTSGNQIQTLNTSGDFLWRFVDTAIFSFAFFSTPAMADLTPGGALEVVAGSRDGHVHCINGADGSEKWSYTTGGMILASPAIADMDGDGSLEVVVGSMDGYVYCLTNGGALKWKFNAGSPIYSSAVLADLDGDGKKEAVVGSNAGQLYALSASSGAVKWSYATGSSIISSPACGDVDGDGSLDIVFGSANSYVYCLNSSGLVKWKTQTGGPVYSSPALAKRGSAAGLDVYVGSDDNYLYLLRGTNGSVLDKFQTSFKISACPAVGDIDGDGKLEIVVMDRSAEAAATSVDSPNGDRLWVIRDNSSSVTPFIREWPMFRADPAHTGLYPNPDSVVAGPPPPPPTPPSGNPPSVPAISATASHTTQPLITVSGTADAGNIVTLFVKNSLGQKTYDNWVYAGGDGNWVISDVRLSAGQNSLTAKAKNSLGQESAECPAVSVSLGSPPLPPTNLSATATGNEIKIGWTLSPSLDVTNYRVYAGTSPQNLSSPSATLSSSATSYAMTGNPGVVYYFLVHAVNPYGEEQNGNLLSIQTGGSSEAFCPSAKIKNPHDGKKVSGESLTIMAEIACGDASGVGSVRFEYQPSTGTTWALIPASNINHPNPDTTFPYFVHWNVGLLSEGQYRIRAVAVNTSGQSDPAPSYVTVNVDHADPDVVEKTMSGTHLMISKVEKDKEHVAKAGFNNQMAEVVIPSGTLTSAQTKLMLTFNPINAPVSSSDTASVQSTLSIELEDGQKTFGKDVTLVLPYKDDDGNGLVDGTKIPEKDISGYTYDDEEGKWKKMASTVDTQKNQVTIKTKHFSFYGVFAPSAETIPFALGEAYIFPNPSRGSQNPIFHIEVGEADEVEVFIYDVSGALVESLRATGSPQTIEGKPAYEISWTPSASGIYVALIQARKSGETDIRLSRKFGVIR